MMQKTGWFVAGVAVAIASAVVIGQASQPGGKLVVDSLVIRDSEGKERIILETFPDGTAGITVTDDHGRDRIMIVSLSEKIPDPAGSRAHMVMLDAEDRERLIIGTSNAGHASLSVFDTNRRDRFTVGTTPDGRAATIQRAADGSVILGTP